MQSNLTNNHLQQDSIYRPLILIVDDNRDNLLFASCVIDAMGLGYLVLDSSEHCLDLVSKLVPDLILLDVIMPKVNGIEIALELKKKPKLAHIPLVAVTGLTKVEDKDSLIRVGFSDYICKPYLIEELERKVNANLKCLV